MEARALLFFAVYTGEDGGVERQNTAGTGSQRIWAVSSALGFGA